MIKPQPNVETLLQIADNFHLIPVVPATCRPVCINFIIFVMALATRPPVESPGENAKVVEELEVEEEQYEYKPVNWKDFITKPKYIRLYPLHPHL